MEKGVAAVQPGAKQREKGQTTWNVANILLQSVCGKALKLHARRYATTRGGERSRCKASATHIAVPTASAVYLEPDVYTPTAPGTEAIVIRGAD